MEQTAYVNRAELVSHSWAHLFLPLFQNPELLYISDLYHAHHCNETAMFNSEVSGNNYYMQSLTYYQNGSLWPNDTGGYVDIEDKTYGQIVREKEIESIMNAQSFMQEIIKSQDFLTFSDIAAIFSLIENEYKTNFKSFRNRIFNFEKY